MDIISKNSYLQSISSSVNPRLLNRCVTKARKLKVDDVHDFFHALNRLISEQPTSSPNNYKYDPSKIFLSYGRKALPVLKRNLFNSKEEIVLQSMSTLNDLLHNPEMAFEAIRLHFPDRMIDLAFRKTQFLAERVCLGFELLANIADGKEAMVRRKKILTGFRQLLSNPNPQVRERIANCLEKISSNKNTVDDLVDYGFINDLINRITTDDHDIAYIHLKTLEQMMYGNGKEIAMEAGAFDIMVQLLDVPDIDMRVGALNCLLLMTSTELGKRMAIDCNILVVLNRLLHEDQRLHVGAAAVLMFCTILTKAKIAASEIKMLPARLVRLSKNRENPDLQLYCFKALTNMCDHPHIRKMLLMKHIGRLKKIQVESELLSRHKSYLLTNIQWDPSDFSADLSF